MRVKLRRRNESDRQTATNWFNRLDGWPGLIYQLARRVRGCPTGTRTRLFFLLFFIIFDLSCPLISKRRMTVAVAL